MGLSEPALVTPRGKILDPRTGTKFIDDLRTHKPDCVMIGAGVRLNPKLTGLFEQLVNLVRQHAPQSRLCFNSGPYDTAKAVERQLG